MGVLGGLPGNLGPSRSPSASLPTLGGGTSSLRSEPMELRAQPPGFWGWGYNSFIFALLLTKVTHAPSLKSQSIINRTPDKKSSYLAPESHAQSQLFLVFILPQMLKMCLVSYFTFYTFSMVCCQLRETRTSPSSLTQASLLPVPSQPNCWSQTESACLAQRTASNDYASLLAPDFAFPKVNTAFVCSLVFFFF